MIKDGFTDEIEVTIAYADRSLEESITVNVKVDFPTSVVLVKIVEELWVVIILFFIVIIAAIWAYRRSTR